MQILLTRHTLQTLRRKAVTIQAILTIALSLQTKIVSTALSML